MKSAAEVNDPRSGRVPAGAPSAGFALLLVLAMAQFMVVLDNTVTCGNVPGRHLTWGNAGTDPTRAGSADGPPRSSWSRAGACCGALPNAVSAGPARPKSCDPTPSFGLPPA